jgi:hypothetical protein
VTTRWRRRALGLLAVCALASCGKPDSATSDNCGEPLRAEPGELRTVLAGSWFDADALLGDAAALPDGSVLVSYDTNPDEAGDADEHAGEQREPGLVVLLTDGSCRPFELPLVDGRRVTADATPVAVDGDDRLYLWDASAHRLVRGPVGASWETVTTIPGRFLQFMGAPAVTVGVEGEIYVATDYRISTVAADGTLATIAGTGEEYRYNTSGPVELPRPATSAALPEVRDIRALPSGGLLVSTKSSVLTLKSGTLDLLADWKTTSGQEGAINRDHWLSSLEVLPTGEVLVSDLPGKRILRLHDGQSTVFLTDSSYLLMAYAASVLADGTGLLVRQDGGQALAVYGLPPD